MFSPRDPFLNPFLLLAICLLPIVSSCAAPFKRLEAEDQRTFLLRAEEQARNVHSFYAAGGLSIKDDQMASDFQVLVMGTRAPFRVKMEVVHPWGRPIAHILIQNGNMEILSFPDKTLYLGSFTPRALGRFFPGVLDPPLIWAALRGYPLVLDHVRSVSLKPHQITLLNHQGEAVEIIALHSRSLRPSRVILPRQNVELAFSDYGESEGIFYARKVSVEEMDGKGQLLIRHKKMVFNRPIPLQVFQVEKPPSFETRYLDQYPLKDRP